MEKLTNHNKFELLEIDVERLRQDIQKEISFDEQYVLNNEELDSIQNIIGDSIELEVELEEAVESTRASFYMKNGQVVVIKTKKLDVKLLFSLFKSVDGLINGSGLTKICTIFDLLIGLLYQIVDKDLPKVYTYLADEYFNNGRRFNNIEIFDAVNQYMKQSMSVKWSNQKIQEKLDKLEYELRVIECIDGVYEVKDKIYFV